jgi:hypothetical protein
VESPSEPPARLVHSRHRNAWQYAVIIACTLVIAVQILHAWKGPADPHLRYVDVAPDFKTFYCAGATANAGQNPYLAAPFERCGAPEQAPLPSFVSTDVHPAPLPGYDIALFRLFALLPYQVAALLWLIASLAALSLAVILVADLSGVAPLAVFAAFAMPLYYINGEWGQLTPIVVGLLAIAACALRREAFGIAGCACVATLLEPHLGVPVCAAVFLWAPRTRIAIAVGVALLAIISAATLGLSENIVFLRTVLPLQVAAEAPSTMQYSLTWVAYVLGVSEQLAIRIGSTSYVLMAVLAIWLARAACRVSKSLELLPVIPAALVVFGGTYMHIFQTSVSTLLGIMLLGYVRRPSPLLWAGVILQVPIWAAAQWLTHPLSATRLESLLAVVTCAFFVIDAGSMQRRLGAAALIGAAYLAISLAILSTPLTILRTPASASDYARELGTNRQYTTGEWGVDIRTDPASRFSTAISIAVKLPVWIGLLCVILGTMTYARGDHAGGTRSLSEGPQAAG